MITKRINTDLFLNLLFKDKLTNQNINYSGANGINLELKKQGLSNTQWANQEFTLTDDGVIHFQWNADENTSLGIYDARISFYKISTASENGKIQYKYDAISLFKIVSTSDDENVGTDTTQTISVLVSWGGFDGMSAYEIAVKYGYTGTEEEFANIEINNAANEATRQTNESTRMANEMARNNAESDRVTAESQRETEFDAIKQGIEELTPTTVYFKIL